MKTSLHDSSLPRFIYLFNFIYLIIQDVKIVSHGLQEELNHIEGKIWAQNVSIRLYTQLVKVMLIRRYVRQYKVHLVSAAVSGGIEPPEFTVGAGCG